MQIMKTVFIVIIFIQLNIFQYNLNLYKILDNFFLIQFINILFKMREKDTS